MRKTKSMTETTFDPTKATFAGTVAAMFLEYVHDLIILADTIREQKITPDHHAQICDRIERNLAVLQNSSMPMPGLTLEEVMQIGRDIAADEEEERGLDDAEQEALLNRAKEIVGRYAVNQEEAAEEPIPEPPGRSRAANVICKECGNRSRSKAHKESCQGPRLEVIRVYAVRTAVLP